MERKEFNLDLVAPKGIALYDVYFDELTKRLNILWKEHSKKEGGNGNKKHEKPYT
ncbi:hypothetical protein [Wolbachia endosymbiont of Cantharis cryptica]|uniref:hypothetical protein n=1 Tax=Wolbachia endosymbiont of Cantharis cryptica TaxID=3066132 RepID=UPI00376EB1D7